MSPEALVRGLEIGYVLQVQSSKNDNILKLAVRNHVGVKPRRWQEGRSETVYVHNMVLLTART